MVDAIILAGGKGTRLNGVLNNIPKSMADIGGKPFLEYQLGYLQLFHFERIILSVGHLHQHIMNYFQDAWNKLEIRYSIEDEPLGTGGAIKRSLDFCRSENVFVFNGDTLFMIDFYGMLAKMEQMSADLVIALREISNANRYGRVDTDETGKITNFREKTADAAAGLINGGIYLIKRSVIDKGGLPDTFSIEKEFFPDLCKKGAIYGVPFNDYFLDIGIPEDLDKARFEFPTLAKQYGILS